MTNNICKEKNCEKEIQAEEEYCHYHKKKHSEKRKGSRRNSDYGIDCLGLNCQRKK